MNKHQCTHQQQLALLAARSNAAMRRGSIAATTAAAELGQQLADECRAKCSGASPDAEFTATPDQPAPH